MRKTSPSAGIFLASQPNWSSEICCDCPRHVLGCQALWRSALGLFSQRFPSLLCDAAVLFRNQQS